MKNKLKDILLDHPAIDQTPAWKKKIAKALKLVMEVYREAGAKM